MKCCKKANCSDADKCGVVSRIFLYICGFSGSIFSLMTMFSCDFLRYYTIPGTNPTSLPEPFFGVESARVGLFSWEDRTEDNAEEAYGDCEPYDQNLEWNTVFTLTQLVSWLAVILCAVSLLVSTIEFVCIHFCCSKFFQCIFMVFAMVTQALTFAIYEAYDLCSGGRSCNLGNGGVFSMLAAIFYLISALLVCASPIPLPWVRRLPPKDGDGCPCCGKKKEDEPLEKAEGGDAPTRSFSEVDRPEEENNAAIAVAAGAAAGASTAAVIADSDGEKEEEKEEKDKPVEDEIAAAAAADCDGEKEEGKEEKDEPVEGDIVTAAAIEEAEQDGKGDKNATGKDDATKNEDADDPNIITTASKISQEGEDVLTESSESINLKDAE